MQPEKIGPPKVELEDNRPPAPGHGRQVRCHQCDSWVEWQWVAEKGALEGNPVAGVLECWQCYIQRVDPNLTWGQVKPLYKKHNVKQRNHRVQHWQDLLSYVTCPEVDPEVEGSKQKLKRQKRKFDVVNAEKEVFETSGGGSSSTARLDTDEDVKFIYGDQYVGINDVVYEGGKKCLLFNWASKTKRKANCGMATLVEESGATITKGRSLEGDIAAHNLCVVSDTRAVGELQKLFGGGYYAFAIGGEYRDPTDKRGHADHYNGIQLMGLTKHKYGAGGIWSALQWKRLRCLLKGDHEGAVEGRSKCKRQSDGRGIAEFDGQSALTYFGSQFFVYANFSC